MLKRKHSLFVTVAFAMIVLFATTAAIAQDTIPTEVTCGAYTINLVSTSNNVFTYAITAENDRQMSKIERVVVFQSILDWTKNPIVDENDVPIGELGAGDSSTKWCQGNFQGATTAVTPVAGGDLEEDFILTAISSLTGAGSIIIDTGKFGIQVCESEIAMPGDESELPVQTCTTEIIPQDPIVDEVNNIIYDPEDCIVETCYNPFRREVISGDCKVEDLTPIEEVFPGMIAIENKTNIKKHTSPTSQCQVYNGWLGCCTPCCPAGITCPGYPVCD
jgi:hypothetical protein